MKLSGVLIFLCVPAILFGSNTGKSSKTTAAAAHSEARATQENTIVRKIKIIVPANRLKRNNPPKSVNYDELQLAKLPKSSNKTSISSGNFVLRKTGERLKYRYKALKNNIVIDNETQLFF